MGRKNCFKVSDITERSDKKKTRLPIRFGRGGVIGDLDKKSFSRESRNQIAVVEG